jgi:hypothetical protein
MDGVRVRVRVQEWPFPVAEAQAVFESGRGRTVEWQEDEKDDIMGAKCLFCNCGIAVWPWTSLCVVGSFLGSVRAEAISRIRWDCSSLVRNYC